MGETEPQRTALDELNDGKALEGRVFRGRLGTPDENHAILLTEKVSGAISYYRAYNLTEGVLTFPFRQSRELDTIFLIPQISLTSEEAYNLAHYQQSVSEKSQPSQERRASSKYVDVASGPVDRP